MATGDAAAAAEPAMASPSSAPQPLAGGHFEYVEVGTSDWGTLTQFCAGQQRTNYVSWLGADIRTSISDPKWFRGLAVEPVKEWLAQGFDNTKTICEHGRSWACKRMLWQVLGKSIWKQVDNAMLDHWSW